MGLLSLAIWLPIVIGAVLLAFGEDRHARMVRWAMRKASSWPRSSAKSSRPGATAR